MTIERIIGLWEGEGERMNGGDAHGKKGKKLTAEGFSFKGGKNINIVWALKREKMRRKRKRRI
jgi:hypothetical protein